MVAWTGRLRSALRRHGGLVRTREGAWDEARVMIDTPRPPQAIFEAADWEETASAIRGWVEQGRLRDRLRASLFDGRWDEGFLSLDHEALLSDLTRARRAGRLSRCWTVRRVRRAVLPALLPEAEAPDLRAIAADLKRARRLVSVEDALNRAAEIAPRLLGRAWPPGSAPDWQLVETMVAWTGRLRSALRRHGGLVRTREGAWDEARVERARSSNATSAPSTGSASRAPTSCTPCGSTRSAPGAGPRRRTTCSASWRARSCSSAT
jgi:hypothetical protein